MILTRILKCAILTIGYRIIYNAVEKVGMGTCAPTPKAYVGCRLIFGSGIRNKPSIATKKRLTDEAFFVLLREDFGFAQVGNQRIH